MKKESGTIIYSPSDLIRYLASPFASWLDRYELENRGTIIPDEQSEEERLLSSHPEWSPKGLRDRLLARRDAR